MDLLRDIGEILRLCEEVEAEILAGIEKRKEEYEKQPRLGLNEEMPGAYERGPHVGGGEAAAARDLAVGAEEARKEAMRPSAMVKTTGGKLLPVTVHQARRDGSIVFELNKRYYMCPGNAVRDQDVQGRPTKVMDAAACQSVG